MCIAAVLRGRVATLLLLLLLLLDSTNAAASLPPLRHTVIVDEAGEAHLSRRSPSGAGQGGTAADAAADAGEERGPTVTLPITLGNVVSVCVLLVLAVVGAGAIHSWGQRPSCSCRLCQGAYTVTRHLGKGGFGAVYEVKGTGVQVPLVMKKIAADSINRANEIQQESKVLRELHHRHVVKHHDDFLHVEEGSLGVGAIFVVIIMEKCALDMRERIEQGRAAKAHAAALRRQERRRLRREHRRQERRDLRARLAAIEDAKAGMDVSAASAAKGSDGVGDVGSIGGTDSTDRMDAMSSAVGIAEGTAVGVVGGGTGGENTQEGGAECSKGRIPISAASVGVDRTVHATLPADGGGTETKRGVDPLCIASPKALKSSSAARVGTPGTPGEGPWIEVKVRHGKTRKGNQQSVTDGRVLGTPESEEKGEGEHGEHKERTSRKDRKDRKDRKARAERSLIPHRHRHESYTWIGGARVGWSTDDTDTESDTGSDDGSDSHSEFTEDNSSEDESDGVLGRGQGEPLAEHTAVRYFLETCDALAHCHAQGIVHRDVKGQNVFLTDEDDSVRLGDFGLARKTMGACDSRYSTGGTDVYKPPESLLGKPLEWKRVDVWGLGLFLYEIIALKFVWEHDGLIGAKVIEKGFAAVDELLKGLPCSTTGCVTDAIRSMLSPSPTERPSVEDVITSLRHYTYPPES